MPKITDMQIQKNNKTRANVYVDGEFAFALEMLSVMKLGLKIGQDVSEERLREAVADSEKSVALEKAMNYLSRGMKTERQMSDYLTKKGFGDEIVAYVLDKLRQYRYLDDDAYAQMYVERNGTDRGAKRLRYELIAKGIEPTRAEQIADGVADEAECAAALAQKYMRNKIGDVKTLQKLQRYLLARGYGYDLVNGIVRGYSLGDSGSED